MKTVRHTYLINSMFDIFWNLLSREKAMSEELPTFASSIGMSPSCEEISQEKLW